MTATSAALPKTAELRLAHSPDSDDAFMFYALATGKVRLPGVKFTHILSDIESLNQAASKETYDITAVSFYGYTFVADKYILMDCGASFGEGYGPIVVSSHPIKKTDLAGRKIAIPGALLLMPGAVWYRLGMGVDEGAAGMSAGRITDIWEPLLPQLIDKPFFGHGLQSVLWAPAMRMDEMFAVTHPHSAFLGALLDFGIVGALFLIAFWFTVWKGFRRLSKDKDLTPQERGFFEGAAASLIAFMAAGFWKSGREPR